MGFDITDIRHRRNQMRISKKAQTKPSPVEETVTPQPNSTPAKSDNLLTSVWGGTKKVANGVFNTASSIVEVPVNTVIDVGTAAVNTVGSVCTNIKEGGENLKDGKIKEGLVDAGQTLGDSAIHLIDCVKNTGADLFTGVLKSGSHLVLQEEIAEQIDEGRKKFLEVSYPYKPDFSINPAEVQDNLKDGIKGCFGMNVMRKSTVKSLPKNVTLLEGETYEYNKETKTFIVKSSDGTQTTEYNKKGQKIFAKKEIYENDDDGNKKLVQVEEYSFNNEKLAGKVTYSNYNEDKKPQLKVTEEYYPNSEIPKNKTSIQYDTDGTTEKSKVVENFDKKGNPYKITRYKDGKLKSEEETTREDNIEKTIFKEYENNKLTKTVTTTKDNKNHQNFEVTEYYKDGDVSKLVKKIDLDGDNTYETVEDFEDFDYLSEESKETLKKYNISIVTDRLKSDIQIVKKAEQEGLNAGKKGSQAYNDAYNASIKAQMIKTETEATGKVGEVVEKEDGLYVTNEKGELEKLNISADTYLKLFPPVERYDIAQHSVGDCYFVSSCLIDMMKNQKAFSKLLQMFSEDEDGNLTLKYAGTLSDYPVTFEKGELKIVDGKVNNKEVEKYKQVSGAKGLVMLEQAYAISRFARDKNRQVKSIDIDETFENIYSGDPLEVYQQIFNPNVNWENLIMADIDSLKDNADKLNNGQMLLSYTSRKINTDIESKYNMSSNHAYSFEKIDSENEMIYMTNPHHGGVSVALPLKELPGLAIYLYNYDKM